MCSRLSYIFTVAVTRSPGTAAAGRDSFFTTSHLHCFKIAGVIDPADNWSPKCSVFSWADRMRQHILWMAEWKESVAHDEMVSSVRQVN